MNKIKQQSDKIRLYYLDWLRVLAFGLLVFYHAGLIFVDWGFHIQNEQLTESLKLPLLFVNQWRLPLLFLVSGAGTRFALGRRTKLEFLKERFIRLFIPLIFGILLVIPPQVYFERLNQNNFDGSYLEFYPRFFNGVYPQGNFTWNHLWFIAYLIVFIVLALPIIYYLRSESGKNLIRKGIAIFSGRLRLLVLVIPLLLAEFLLRDRWPDTRNLISDWYNFVFYIVIFLYGYFIASSERLWTTIEKDRIVYLLLGVVSFLMIYVGWHQTGENFLEKFRYGGAIFIFFKCLNIWSWILCALGYAKRYLSRNSTSLQYANKAVYPFYILHQTVLIAIGYYVIKLDTGIGTKYTAIVVGTFVLTMLLYDLLIRRVSFVKVLFGVK